MTADDRISRRDFIKIGAAAGGAALAGTQLVETAFANRHPAPRPTSLSYLDRNMYRKNTDVLAVFSPGHHRGNKMQMMAVGERRYLFQAGDVIDVSNPVKPELVGRNAFLGSAVQLAYNNKLGKWILMTGRGSRATFSTPKWPHGKYDNPLLIEANIKEQGLRGVRFYDATDPAKLVPLSEWACDQGDPRRPQQTGSGTHRNYYDGGQYAYLDTAPGQHLHQSGGLVPLLHQLHPDHRRLGPGQPQVRRQLVGAGTAPGRGGRVQEVAEYGDKTSFNSLHGPMYVPKRVEEGGRYGYSAYGSFGMLIHDLSDIRKPRLVSVYKPPRQPGSIPFHTIDIVRLDRGFVIANPEVLNPDCNEPLMDTFIVDVRDPANPRQISRLPIPVPPPDAPYRDFCDKRGRFGPHNPPHMKAPGKAHPGFHRVCLVQRRTAALRRQQPAGPEEHRLLHPRRRREPWMIT